jgi:hypothetical protein
MSLLPLQTTTPAVYKTFLAGRTPKTVRSWVVDGERLAEAKRDAVPGS